MKIRSTIAKIIGVMLALSSVTLIYSAFAATATLNLAVTAGSLTVNIVDGDGAVVSSPSFDMTGVTWTNETLGTSTGTLGEATKKIRVTNPRTDAEWTLTLAATDAGDGLWTDGGSNRIDFNDSADGADGADTDTAGGQLSVGAVSGATFAGTGDPATDTANITKGAGGAFSGADPITLLTGTATAAAPGEWDLYGVALTQKIPARTAIGNYTLGMTLSVQ